MRALVFLLVLGNLLFFTLAQAYFGTAKSPDADRVSQQIRPERMRIVASGEPPAEGVLKTAAVALSVPVATALSAPVSTALSAPLATALSAPAATALSAPVAAEPPRVAACATWTGLTVAEADRFAKAVAERAPSVRLQRQVEAGPASSWWVMIPPLPAKVDAERKAGELKRLNVSDFYIIQDAGPNRFAISLGLFSTEAAANTQLEMLRAKGVRSARVRPKTSGEPHVTVELRGDAAALDAAKGLLSERAPGTCRPVVAKAP